MTDAAEAQEVCPCGTPFECIPGSPGCVIKAEKASVANPQEKRTIPMRMRGTLADAPKVRRLLDAVAVFAPNNDFGYALAAWAEEVTRLVEGR